MTWDDGQNLSLAALALWIRWTSPELRIIHCSNGLWPDHHDDVYTRPDADDDYTFTIISNLKKEIADCFAKSLGDAIRAYESGDTLMFPNILIQRHSYGNSKIKTLIAGRAKMSSSPCRRQQQLAHHRLTNNLWVVQYILTAQNIFKEQTISRRSSKDMS